MELLIDNYFKETYEFYFGNLRSTLVLEAINKAFEGKDSEIIVDAINIIKTSKTLGLTYRECYDKVVEKILPKFPLSDDVDKFVLSLTVKVIVASGSDSIDKLLKSKRNVIKEVAAKHFRVPFSKVTNDMITNVVEAANAFDKESYSVNDSQVESWDEYFYNVSRQVARNSKCFSRRIGAVLVEDKSIISTGYNGPPRGAPRCDMRWKLDLEFAEKYKDKVEGKNLSRMCPRRVIGFQSGEGLNICVAGHAERNALINAARNGIKTKGTSLYMTCGIPCSPCLIEIINAGVKEIIVTSLRVYDNSSMYLLNQSDLGVRLFDFIK
jgi:dCMP deaminase